MFIKLIYAPIFVKIPLVMARSEILHGRPEGQPSKDPIHRMDTVPGMIAQLEAFSKNSRTTVVASQFAGDFARVVSSVAIEPRARIELPIPGGRGGSSTAAALMRFIINGGREAQSTRVSSELPNNGANQLVFHPIPDTNGLLYGRATILPDTFDPVSSVRISRCQYHVVSEQFVPPSVKTKFARVKAEHTPTS